MPQTHRDVVRINLEVTRGLKETMNHLQTLLNASSTTEVIRRSVLTLNELKDCECSGGEIILRFPDGKENKIRFI